MPCCPTPGRSCARRSRSPPRARSCAPSTASPAWSRSTKDGRTTRVLFDTGISQDGLIENMRRLELAPGDIDVIVLSHGHWDHTTGMHGLAAALGRTQLPVLIHPEFWTRRRVAIPGREPIELPSASRGALEGAGFDIVEQRQPSFLLDGSLLVTGEVDRTTAFERGFPAHQAERHGQLGAGPADPRRPGARRPRARARARGDHRLRPLRDRQHPPLRAPPHRRGPPARGDRRLPPQRGALRADHRADLRRAGRARARPPRAVPLHRLARDPHARRADAGRVHPEQRRQPLHLPRPRRPARGWSR